MLLLSLVLTSLVSGSPIYNFSSSNEVSLSVDIPHIYHEPKGELLNSTLLFDYLDSIASYVQLLNCDSDDFVKSQESCFSPYVKGLSPNNGDSNCDSQVEFQGFVKPRWKGYFDMEIIPFLKNTLKAGIFLDHQLKRIVVAFRSDLTLIDHLPFGTDHRASYRPVIYDSKFWNRLNSNATFLTEFGVERMDKVYDAKKGTTKLRAKRILGLEVHKVHVNFQELANRIFEDIFTQVVHIQYKYSDYPLVFTGHSIGAGVASLVSLGFLEAGLDNTLISFNGPRAWSRILASYYDTISETNILHSLVALGDQDGLENVKRGHLRVWNSNDGWSTFPANTLAMGLGLLNRFKHTGLSIVTPQRNPLAKDNKPSFVLESSMLRKFSNVDKGAGGRSDAFAYHNIILRDMLACAEHR